MPKKYPRNAQETLNEIQLKIIELIKENNGITQVEMAKYINVNRDVIKYNISVLKVNGIITREGSTKKGVWKVL